MSDISMDQYEEYEKPLKPQHFIEVFQDDSGGLRKEKQIPINEVGVDIGLKLNLSRIAMQELTSVGMLTVGWNKIAFVEALNNRSGASDFKISVPSARSTLSFSAEFGNSSSAKTRENTPIVVTGRNDQSGIFGGVRITKSDSIGASGAFIELEILQSMQISTTLIGNTGRSKGFELLEPILSDGKLPDGVTVATFLEAGAEFNYPDANLLVPGFTARAVGNDSLKCCVSLNELPKTGSSCHLQSSGGDIRFHDGLGLLFSSLGVLNVDYTISNFFIKSATISFQINQIDIALNFTPFINVWCRYVDSDFKIIII